MCRVPRARNAIAHELTVAPVVTRSSTMATRGGEAPAEKASAKFAHRCAAPRAVWSGPVRVRWSSFLASMPRLLASSRASTSAWSKPLIRMSLRRAGTQVMTSAQRPEVRLACRMAATRGPAADRSRRSLKSSTRARAAPSYSHAAIRWSTPATTTSGADRSPRRQPSHKREPGHRHPAHNRGAVRSASRESAIPRG